MPRILLVFLLLAVLPARAAEAPRRPRLVVIELVAAGGVEKEVAAAMTEAVTQEVSARRFFDVMSTADIQAIIGAERRRQLAGCAEDSSSCQAEIAGAIGARFVLSGSVAKLGDAYQLSLQTLDTTRAQPLGRSTRIARDLATLRMQLPYSVAEATATPLPPPPSRILPYSLMGVGGATFLAGALTTFDSLTRESTVRRELEAGGSNPSELQSLSAYRTELSAISTERGIGLAVIAAGVALVGAGIWLNPSDGPAKVALVPTGRGVGLAGRWP